MQVLAFTMMGIIVNAGSVLKYVTMALLVIVYMHDCYNNVYENYLTFNKTIIDDMIERTTDDLRRIASMPSDMQENAAFLVRTTSISFWLKLAELQLLFRFVPVLCFTLMFLFRWVMAWDFFKTLLCNSQCLSSNFTINVSPTSLGPRGLKFSLITNFLKLCNIK